MCGGGDSGSSGSADGVNDGLGTGTVGRDSPDTVGGTPSGGWGGYDTTTQEAGGRDEGDRGRAAGEVGIGGFGSNQTVEGWGDATRDDGIPDTSQGRQAPSDKPGQTNTFDSKNGWGNSFMDNVAYGGWGVALGSKAEQMVADAMNNPGKTAVNTAFGLLAGPLGWANTISGLVGGPTVGNLAMSALNGEGENPDGPAPGNDMTGSNNDGASYSPNDARNAALRAQMAALRAQASAVGLPMPNLNTGSSLSDAELRQMGQTPYLFYSAPAAQGMPTGVNYVAPTKSRWGDDWLWSSMPYSGQNNVPSDRSGGWGANLLVA